MGIVFGKIPNATIDISGKADISYVDNAIANLPAPSQITSNGHIWQYSTVAGCWTGSLGDTVARANTAQSLGDGFGTLTWDGNKWVGPIAHADKAGAVYQPSSGNYVDADQILSLVSIPTSLPASGGTADNLQYIEVISIDGAPYDIPHQLAFDTGSGCWSTEGLGVDKAWSAAQADVANALATGDGGAIVYGDIMTGVSNLVGEAFANYVPNGAYSLYDQTNDSWVSLDQIKSDILSQVSSSGSGGSGPGWQQTFWGLWYTDSVFASLDGYHGTILGNNSIDLAGCGIRWSCNDMDITNYKDIGIRRVDTATLQIWQAEAFEQYGADERGDLQLRNIDIVGSITVNSNLGATGSFVASDGQTVTVTNGIITSISY